MRQIKFRGKRPHNNKWITGCYVEKGIHAYILGNGHWEVECATEVLRETVGQFTGLKDNSEEKEDIYEGDIIEDESGTRWRVNWIENMAGFFLRNIDARPERFDTISCRIDKSTRYEIIGNIHDNPELLGIEK